MRALLVAALLLAGCVSGEADSPAADPPAATTPDAPGSEAGTDVFTAEAPDLPPGRAFTFRKAYLYDPEDRMTVVVARADAAGYLFAGATEADVVSAAIWSRSWYGELDRSLSTERLRFFDFPLVDGKSWTLRKGITVTAHAQDVETPTGPEAGFVVRGVDEDGEIEYHYAPSVGWYTRYIITVGDAVFADLRLERVDAAASYVHWEVLAEAETREPAPATLQVPQGADAVLASAGGRNGGRAVFAPPPAESTEVWAESFPGEEEWRTRVYEPHPGAWTLVRADSQDGFGYLRAVAVKWVKGPVVSG